MNYPRHFLLHFALPVVLSIVFSCAPLVYADHPGELRAARDAFARKDYPGSVVLFRVPLSSSPVTANDLYDGARAAALAGNPQLAVEWLSRAVEIGPVNPRRVSTDPDLKTLHGEIGWAAIVERAQRKAEQMPPNVDLKLRKELLEVMDADQKLRVRISEVEKRDGRNSDEFRKLWEQQKAIDAANLVRITAILDRDGWVGPEKTGPRANSALFLVIQHSNLEIQKKYLPLLREAVTQKRAAPSSLALLEDRVAIGEGRPQIYGSQVGQDPISRTYHVLPIVDPEKVDERRSGVGLEPISSYLKQWNIGWDPKSLGQPPNKAPEPTPVSLTPRATEGTLK